MKLANPARKNKAEAQHSGLIRIATGPDRTQTARRGSAFYFMRVLSERELALDGPVDLADVQLPDLFPHGQKPAEFDRVGLVFEAAFHDFLGRFHHSPFIIPVDHIIYDAVMHIDKIPFSAGRNRPGTKPASQLNMRDKSNIFRRFPLRTAIPDRRRLGFAWMAET